MVGWDGVGGQGGLQQLLEQGGQRWQQEGRAGCRGQLWEGRRVRAQWREGQALSVGLRFPRVGLSSDPRRRQRGGGRWSCSYFCECCFLSVLLCMCVRVCTVWMFHVCLHMLTGSTCLGSLRVGPGDAELPQPCFSWATRFGNRDIFCWLVQTRANSQMGRSRVII